MEKKERKFLVAVDESKESMFALYWCITKLIPHTTNVKLVLLYVQPTPAFHSFIASGCAFYNDVILDMDKYCIDLVDSVMERAGDICKKSNTTDIKIERIIGRGDAKDVICNAVKKFEADTLVMGTHSYGFFKRALVGSVSDYCAMYAKCPVVIVKHP
ncbi:universal stress protein PHOS32-like [Trifolium pratense]|uniref:universal stress protein PHOS32-like n=1 Tax=Trifolium pratense TaxID=57577 RepID=UPI001E69356B|nr:universal stress protein PHOS32-like [Trifolium pratense]